MIKKLLLPLLLTSTPAMAQFSTEEWVLIGSAAADLATTEVGLAQGAEEINPLMKNCSLRLAAKAGAVGVMIWGTRRLRRNGHPLVAKWLSGVAIGINSFATGWNVAIIVGL